MELCFEKITENKALHIIIKRIKRQSQDKKQLYGSDCIYTNINGLKDFNKEILKLCDFVYYNCLLEEDVVDIRKKLVTKLRNYKISYKDFYITKFRLSNILLNASVSEDLLFVEPEDMYTFSLVYQAMCVLEIIFCKTSKRVITGIDAENNKLKYLPDNNLYFDRINSKFVTSKIKDVYFHEFEKMFNILSLRFPELDESELVMRANDKVDELLTSYSEVKILLDLFNIKGDVSLEKRINCLNTTVCSKIDKSYWEDKQIVCEKPVVLKYKDGIKIVKVQDINIDENYPCVVLSYVDNDGVEDTHIIPITMDMAVFTGELDMIDRLMKFYCKDENENDKSIMYSEDLWKDRFSTDLDKKARNYKRQVVPIFMHKAKMGKPSKSALDLARKWNIELKPGETLVKSHLRRYGEK